MEKSRVGIYGGTFNPPHIGHVKAAEAFSNAVKPDRLLIMPDYLPPHKDFKSDISPSDRFEMCKMAFGHIKNVEISDFEIKRGGKSYTSVTLSEFSSDDRDLYFLCGTDMFMTLDSWYDFKTIFKLATICCVRREDDGEMLRRLAEKRSLYEKEYGARVIFVESDVYPASSSEIRSSLRELDRDPSIPEAVYRYINEKGLYR